MGKPFKKCSVALIASLALGFYRNGAPFRPTVKSNEPKFKLMESVKISRPDDDEINSRAIVVGWQPTERGSFLYNLVWEDGCEGMMFEGGLEKAYLL